MLLICACPEASALSWCSWPGVCLSLVPTVQVGGDAPPAPELVTRPADVQGLSAALLVGAATWHRPRLSLRLLRAWMAGRRDWGQVAGGGGQGDKLLPGVRIISLRQNPPGEQEMVMTVIPRSHPDTRLSGLACGAHRTREPGPHLGLGAVRATSLRGHLSSSLTGRR